MKNRNLILAVMLCLLCAFQAAGQTCEELYREANALFKAEKYDKAKVRYRQALNCGDAFFEKDCLAKIELIDRITYRARKSVPFGLSDDSVTIPYQGGQEIVTINGSGSWTVSLDSDWCTIRKTRDNIIITSQPNEALDARTCEIRVHMGTQYKILTVTNEGAPEVLRSSAENISFPSEGETNTIDIFANTDWEVAEAPAWVKVDRTDGGILLTAAANEQNRERHDSVKIETPSNSVIIINIYQSAGRDRLAFSKNDLHFGPEGGDEYIRVFTDADGWNFGDFPHWCQLTRDEKGWIKVHCTPNEPNNLPREASVNVTTGRQTLGINVSQDAKPSVTVIPTGGIGGRAVSFGMSVGYVLPSVSTSGGGKFTGSVVNYALGTDREQASYSSKGGYSVSAFADMRIYKNFYLTAGLNFIHYAYGNEFNADVVRTVPMTEKYALRGTAQNCYEEEYRMSFLEIPVLFSYRLPVTRNSHIQFNAGPVFSCGLSAKMKFSGSTDSETMYAYVIRNHQITNDRFDAAAYSLHYVGTGSLNLYDGTVSYDEFHPDRGETVRKDTPLGASPFKRFNIGARLGVAYEYMGIHFGLEYNFMLTNMAEGKFWDGDRWTPFDETSSAAMSGYRQKNNYLQIRIGYTFRY